MMNVRLRWGRELTRNYSRSRTRSALRCKKGSGFLVNVLRGERLFVGIFRVGSGAVMMREVRRGLCKVRNTITFGQFDAIVGRTQL